MTRAPGAFRSRAPSTRPTRTPDSSPSRSSAPTTSRAGDGLLRRHQQGLRSRQQLRQDPQQRGPVRARAEHRHVQRDDPRPGDQRPDAVCARLPLRRPPAASGNAQPGDDRPPAERSAGRRGITENPLGYPQVPTDGDPLQFVNGTCSARSRPGRYAHVTRARNPAWAQALTRSPTTPGSGSYRFWMWNQPASTLASTVEKYLADAEAAQPNTTVALSTYSLVHGACERPERDQEPLRELDHAARTRHRQLPRRPLPRGGLADRDALPHPRRAPDRASRTSSPTRSTRSRRIRTC